MKRVQRTEKQKRSFDRIANDYDDSTNTVAHRVNEYVNMENLLEVLKHEEIESILDAGGGTGKYSIELAKLGFRVTLSDISDLSLEVARTRAKKLRLNIEIMESDMETTDFPSDSFDFILSIGPFSYTPSPFKMLREMYRVLKPNGLMWIEFYNSLGWAFESNDIDETIDLATQSEKLIQMQDWDYPARVFSIKRAQQYCFDAGFEIERVYGNHVLLNSLPLQLLYSNTVSAEQMEAFRAIELELSRNKQCIAVSKNIQLICRKR